MISIREILPALIITGILFAPIIIRMTGYAYDYVVHRDLAVKLLETHAVSAPHFLLQLAIIVLNLLLPGSIDNAFVVVIELASISTAAVIAERIYRETESPRRTIWLTLSLLLAAPVALLAPLDGHFYFGYIPTNVYHNPTIILLKPLALISFGFSVMAFSKENRSQLNTWLLCALATIACGLTKPSFTICILPALALFAGFKITMKCTIDWKLLAFGFFIPAVTLLAGQYWITFSASQIPGVLQGKSDIIFAPFSVMKAYSSGLPFKFLLSLLFPLSVLATRFKSAIRDTSLQLAWLLFLAGACCTYLLAESGPRFLQGNFTWSGQITLFLLFAYSLFFLLKEQKKAPGSQLSFLRERQIICSAALGLHVLFGIIFYILEFIQTEQYW